jgi:hypothetical protein
MTGDLVQFGSRTYALLFLLLVFSRGMDFLSTWVATPNLLLEGNPIARKLGWKGGIPVNCAMCFLFAFWPVPAIVISTTSLLVAARNFQGAWLMRSMGEEAYREWHVERLKETSATLFLFCLLAQTSLFASIGAGIVYFAWDKGQVLVPVGLGFIAYALAVVFYSVLGVWRLRRADLLIAHLKAKGLYAASAQDPRKQPGLIDIYSPEPPPG